MMLRYSIIGVCLLAIQACSGAFELSQPAVKDIHKGLTSVSEASTKANEFIARVCLPHAVLAELVEPCAKVIEYKDPGDEALQLIIDTFNDLFAVVDATTGGEGE